MTEMRQKVNDILRTDYGSVPASTVKREVTNGIVNDIKDKIKDFKNKKNSEKLLAKDSELNLEVNMDMLNKFKKTKTIASPVELSPVAKKETTENENPNIGNKYKSNLPSNVPQQKKFEDFKKEISFSPSGIEESRPSRASNPLTMNNSRCHTPVFDESPLPRGNNMVNNINARPIKSFLVTNEEKRNKSEDKKVAIENKRSNLLETLQVGGGSNNNNINNYRPHFNNNRVTSHKSEKGFIGLNMSTHSNRSNEEKKNNSRIKDKIKNFVFEIEGISSKKSEKTVNSSHQNKLINKKNDYFNNYNTTLHSNPLIAKEENSKKSSSIFDDIKIPKFMARKQKSIDFDFKSNQRREDDSFFKSKNEFDVTSTSAASGSMFKLKAEDIRKLSSQIRFCSPEELRKMDENLVEELINLSISINKTFEFKIKAREFKSK